MRGRRGERAQVTSYAMVPRRSAHSQARDLLVALAADQDNLVAGLHLSTRPAVDEDLVHRDGTSDRPAPATDQHLTAHLGQPAWRPVAVTNRDGGDDRGDRKAVVQAIGEALAGGDLLGIRDFGLEGQCRHQRPDGGVASHRRSRCQAVDGDPRPDHLVAGGGVHEAPAELAAWRRRGRVPPAASAPITPSKLASCPAV